MSRYIDADALGIGKANRDVFDNKSYADGWNADNYCKLLLDGLVAAGVIADDDFAHISLSLASGYDKDNPRVVVEVMY